MSPKSLKGETIDIYLILFDNDDDDAHKGPTIKLKYSSGGNLNNDIYQDAFESPPSHNHMKHDLFSNHFASVNKPQENQGIDDVVLNEPFPQDIAFRQEQRYPHTRPQSAHVISSSKATQKGNRETNQHGRNGDAHPNPDGHNSYQHNSHLQGAIEAPIRSNFKRAHALQRENFVDRHRNNIRHPNRGDRRGAFAHAVAAPFEGGRHNQRNHAGMGEYNIITGLYES